MVRKGLIEVDWGGGKDLEVSRMSERGSDWQSGQKVHEKVYEEERVRLQGCSIW